MSTICRILTSLILFALLATPALASGKYFMTIFAYNSVPSSAENSHTFASFTQEADDGFSTRTISWLPANGVVNVFGFSTLGRNHSLDSTLSIAMSKNVKILSWGPYEINPELFRRATIQQSFLENGEARYKAFILNRSRGVFNCITAVADLDTDRGYLHPKLAVGGDASLKVLRHLSRWIVNPQPDDFVFDSLGLSNYPVTREFFN